MKIETLLVGKPKMMTFRDQNIESAIFKNRVNKPTMLTLYNLEGDLQADLTVHGGRDKALYAYSSESYVHWKKLRPQNSFENGSMGENISVSHLFEDQIFLGDIFEIGTAIVQAVQPRFPCQKLGIKFNDMKILKEFIDLDRPGIYFRVLTEGLINEGDSLKLIGQEKTKISISEMFRLALDKKPQIDRLRELLQITCLPDNWKKDLQKLI